MIIIKDIVTLDIIELCILVCALWFAAKQRSPLVMFATLANQLTTGFLLDAVLTVHYKVGKKYIVYIVVCCVFGLVFRTKHSH